MRALGALLLAGAALPLAGGLRLVAHEEALAAQTYEEVYYVPPPAWLRVLSLGHREALADLLWCRSLVYLGEQFAHGAGMDLVFDYAEAMLALDPDFLAVYTWIGTAGVYQPDAITATEVNRAIDLMVRGRERFPDDGGLAWTLGATLSFELPPLVPPEERDEVRLRGLEHLMDATRLGAAPEWLVLSSTSQLATLGRAEQAAQYLEEMYLTVSDESVRAEIAARIEDVRSEAYGQAFVEANERMERERLRRYPYVHPSLYFLIAPSEAEVWDGELGFGHGVIDELTLAVEP